MKYCKGFPKTFQSEMEIHEDGYPLYQRRNNDRQIMKYIKNRDIIYLDNRWIISYNSYYSLKYEAHINIEIYMTIRCIKYIHKYIYKDSDHAIMEFSVDNNQVDEIKQYLNARYIG